MTLKDKAGLEEDFNQGNRKRIYEEEDVKAFIKKIKLGIKKQLKELKLEGIEVVSNKVIDQESGFEDGEHKK